jgi:hypothetical protein
MALRLRNLFLPQFCWYPSDLPFARWMGAHAASRKMIPRQIAWAAVIVGLTGRLAYFARWNAASS